MAHDPNRSRLRPLYGEFVARDDSVRQWNEQYEHEGKKEKQNNKWIICKIFNGKNRMISICMEFSFQSMKKEKKAERKRKKLDTYSAFNCVDLIFLISCFFF